MSEIRTSEYRTTPKSEQIPIRYERVRISDLRFNWRSDFGQLTKLGRFIYKDRHEKNIYLYKTV